jgi:hypothetical protein
MTDLQDIPYSEKLRFVSFDISNMCSNVPTAKLPQIISLICDQLHTTKRFKRDIIKLVRTVIKQNYFQFQNQIFRHNEGLAVGAPSSSILSQVYLQYVEHTVIYNIRLRNQILGYFRYVDDILIVYDADLTNINEVLNSFNDATPTMQFTVEEGKNNQKNFLDTTIRKDNN